MDYYLGLSVGQSFDYSALVIIERRGERPEALCHCRHVQRWTPRTPYGEIVRDVGRMLRSGEVQAAAGVPVLALDTTGTGAPVLDLFRRELRQLAPLGVFFDYEEDRPEAGAVAHLEALLITGGADVTRDGGLTRIPKRDLISAAQVALQAGRLKIAAELAEAQTLMRELQNFQVKITLGEAADAFAAWREGADDGLVLALCSALWFAEEPAGRFLAW